MCLAVPMRVENVLPDELAIVEMGGVRKTVSLALVDGVSEGDYVIVHVGFALTRLDPTEAQKTLALFDEIAQAAFAGGREAP
ncbi:HypC/HybG/HupF family hydrogenase formation chaperone [Acidiferrobacter sp.]|uniref:HypC/HybG/HupF family hydrogenase formation chaperone n=1 Tax=Acidiferrobacter sp. TaxID=1872107 RepID=UPI0026017FEB|nr:HypC/HybG/HupF family hydrogenase formation chaperone [Acidiferrobacter sp.]